MWQKNNFAENQDSDQSISEEEDCSPDWPGNCISLGGPAEKGGLQIQSQLEILRDTCGHGKTGFFIEDEVELPFFHNEGDLVRSPRRASTCKLDGEIFFDEELHNKFHFLIQKHLTLAMVFEVKKNAVLSTLPSTSGAKDFQKVNPQSFGNESQNEVCTWSTVAKEAKALVHLNENAGCSSSQAFSSKTNWFSKAGRGKAKPKFSFRFQSHKGDSWPVDSKDGNDMPHKLLENIDHITMEHSVADRVGTFQGKKMEQLKIYAAPTELAVGHNYAEHSMAELLDGYQESNDLVQRNFKMNTKTRGKMVQLVKRSIPLLDSGNMDDNNPPETLDSGTSSDEEANVQNLNLIIPESIRKTIAEQFHEALGAASMHGEGPLFALPRQLGVGLFGKLQRVMHSEKERDMDFLKRLQTGAFANDEASCIDVKILSRSLEAKLTVCCCSLSIDKKSSHWAGRPLITKENGERTLTIIFSSKACGDVELEVGNLVRIHPPWYEQYNGKRQG
ncbi:uncharacterized protein LOC132268855 isoform X2 [Cornus florida]|uniref:uncharacterized protein LOC132268855 isoform X2 n=1 Tax=Cornus florida TaxID=4283 RepID=UPI00289BE34E|nr:uncharacterized protein LOC132268855 isoform X2 [Cornus florida]